MFIEVQSRFESIGVRVTRYGIVAVLLLIGLAKFTPEEAAGIQPLVAHSPFMFWMYHLFSVGGVSRIIGSIEIISALLIASRPFSPKTSLVGSVAAVVTFLLTDKLPAVHTRSGPTRRRDLDIGTGGTIPDQGPGASGWIDFHRE